MQNIPDMTKVVQFVEQIYAISEKLTRLTGRPFTPDGHMVGSTGEVLAAFIYGLELLPQSTATHDASPHGWILDFLCALANTRDATMREYTRNEIGYIVR